MNLLIHLFKKDFRYIGVWTALTLATWSLLLLHPFLAASVFDRGLLLLFVKGVGWMMTLITLARLIQLDPSIGSDQFLSVRPVSRGMVIGSKFLVAGVALILPLFVIQVLHIALLALDLSSADYLLLVPGLLLPLTATVLFLLLPAVFTRRTGSAVLVLIGVVVLAFLSALIFSYASVGVTKTSIQPELKYLAISRYYVTVGIFIGCAVWAAAGFAITRRRVQPTLAAVGFITLSVLAGNYWPFNFVNALREKGPTVPVAEQPDMNALSLVHTRRINGGGPSVNRGTEDGIRIDTLTAPYKVEGLSKPWFARQETFESSARFGNGTVIQSQRIPPSFWGRTNPLESATIEMLGFSNASNKHETGTLGINVFFTLAEEFERAKAISPLVSIDGTSAFTIARPKVLHILPLHPGASATNRHARYTIRQVSRYPGRMTLKIAVEFARVPLRGEISSGLGRDTLFLVASPTKKIFYPSSESGSASFEGLGFYSLGEKSFSMDTADSSVDLEQLRLYIVTPEIARQIDLPFLLKGKDLP